MYDTTHDVIIKAIGERYRRGIEAAVRETGNLLSWPDTPVDREAAFPKLEESIKSIATDDVQLSLIRTLALIVWSRRPQDGDDIAF